jgi:hypothetical protein
MTIPADTTISDLRERIRDLGGAVRRARDAGRWTLADRLSRERDELSDQLVRLTRPSARSEAEKASRPWA